MHAQEHVLGEVFGPSRVAERARDDAEHEPPVAADQFRERLVAAFAAQAHEIVVCRDRTCTSRSECGGIIDRAPSRAR